MAGLAASVPLTMGPLSIIVRLSTIDVKEAADINTVCCGDESATTHGPIRAKRIMECPECLARGGHKKGRQLDDESWQILTAEDLQALKPEPIKKMDLIVHDLGEVNAMTTQIGASYFLTLNEKKSGPEHLAQYAVLREIIREAGHAGKGVYTQYTLTTTTSVWLLGLFQDNITLSRIEWPSAIRAVPALPEIVLSPGHKAAAKKLLAGYERAFTPDLWVNERSAAKADVLDGAEIVAAGGATGGVTTSFLDQVALLAPPAAPRKKAAPRAAPRKKAA